MIHHLTGGRWGFVIRRFLEAGFSTVPLMAILFVPICFGLGSLYPWARPDLVNGAAVLRKRHPYMSTEWFIMRSVLCLGLWSLIAWWLRKASLAQDKTIEVTSARLLRTMSGPGVLIYPLTATFAYIDWILSLEVEWYSTIFAVIVITGQVLAALALAVVLLRVLGDGEFILSLKREEIYQQLGNLLLTFVLFWTYLSFSQLLIIYSANLPQEIDWYLHRIAGGWHIIVALIAAFHFFVPFCLLLFRSLKRNLNSLATIAAILLATHVLALYWLVAPSIHPDGPAIHWLDVATFIGVGGVWLGAFAGLLLRAPLLPQNDPRMTQELAYETA